MSASSSIVKRLRTACPLFAFSIFLSGAAAAQLELATFQGTVKDDQGQPLAGAHLRLTDLARGKVVTFSTDKKGFFYRRNLQPSEYEVTVEKEGYQPFKDRLRFRAGEEKQLDFRLGQAASPGGEAFEEGSNFFRKGEYARAARSFEEAVRLAPDSAEAHANLGLAYLQISKLDEGIKALEKAVALEPGLVQIELQLAAAYAQAKQFDKAIGGFEKALQGFSDLSDPVALEATLGLGSLYFAAGRVGEAIAVYQKALAARPGSPLALQGLGKCYFNQGDPGKALEYFEKLVAMAPDSPEAAQARVFIEEIQKMRK